MDKAMRDAHEKETRPLAKQILGQLLENLDIAGKDMIPICQDTEMCIRDRDVQCFDLKAIESIRENPKHQEISAMRYASPAAKSAAVDSLDVVILGATQVDVNFNVNVHTDSNGYIMGGSGGHSDTAAGSKDVYKRQW